MKASEAVKAFFTFLILGILASGCASTTLFQTSPEGADIYVSGQIKGLTPYPYSDKKVAFSSTPITFKKNGYNDLNVILKRDEQPDLGALIGGMIAYVPLLWIMKYDPVHHYELERTDKTGKGNIISDSDSILANNLTDLETYNSGSQGDALVNIHREKAIFHFGIGGGFGYIGEGHDTATFEKHLAGLLGMNFTFVLPSNWGGNFSCIGNITKSKDTPDDYYDDGARVFSPKDYFNILTINLIREFPISDGSVRLGLEAGPSWVSYSKAEFRPNPDYHSSDEPGSWWFSTYKYYKSHSGTSTVGASLGVKAKFLFAPLIGAELEAFTNINSIRPTTGFMVHLILGNFNLDKLQ